MKRWSTSAWSSSHDRAHPLALTARCLVAAVKIALFSQVLANLPAQRVADLNRRFGIECVYVLVWPNYEPPIAPHPQANRLDFAEWAFQAGVPVWAWINCRKDQDADVAKIQELHAALKPSGWLLDVEGDWVKTDKLETLCAGAAGCGVPVRASLAGFNPSGVSYDYRAFDRYGIACEWQAYMDSGEGPDPATAVRELHQSSFVLGGWEYRHRYGSAYGWGKVTRIEGDMVATFDSFKRSGANDATFAVGKRPEGDWGKLVVGRNLVREGKNVGLLMGRATYARTRVALDVTRTAQNRRPEEWMSIAASARIPGAAKRGVSVYLAENASDDVIGAIAAGAA